VAPLIKEKMIMKGTLMIGYQPLKYKNLGNFFRMVVHCLPPPTDKEMDFVLVSIL
jgi:sulfinoalanine decarboxylase/aspartate 1-decarboxylase